MKVYLVSALNTYDEAGFTIFGIYSTKELAEKAMTEFIKKEELMAEAEMKELGLEQPNPTYIGFEIKEYEVDEFPG